MKFNFQNLLTFEQRIKESQSLREKYKDRVTVICEKDPYSNLNSIEKTKFLCPADMNISQFNFLIRSNLKLTEEVSIFLLINGKKIISGDETMRYLYETFKNKDGFLYIAYTSEIFWGKNN